MAANVLGVVTEIYNAIKATTEVILQIGDDIDKLAKNTIHAADKIGGAWIKINDTAFKTARTMAASKEQAVSYNDYLLRSTRELAAVWGKSAEDFARFQEQYAEAIGRNITLNEKQLEQIAHMEVISDKATARKFVDEFDKIGGSLETADIYMAHIQEKAKMLGVSPAKATKTMADNIKLASSYSFRDGVADIEKMAIKAASMRMDMNAIMTATEKFSNIEGAISTSANIQMLGGSFAREFSNPMGAMYESLADPEAFQQRLLRTIEGKGSYNAKTGTVTFDPITMMQMKEMAKQLGVSVDQLTNPAIAQIQGQKVEEELQATGNYSGWGDEELELIKNLSRNNFDEKEGKHFVNVLKNGKVEKTYLEDLTKEELEIAKDSQLSEENMEIDVRRMRELLEESHGRAKGTLSLKQIQNGLEGFWEGFKATFQNLYMSPVVNPLYHGVASFISDFASMFANGGIVEPTHAANGTIIPGDSYIGDKTPVLANAGEMIINKMQQKSLFGLIKSLTSNIMPQDTNLHSESISSGLIDSEFINHLAKSLLKFKDVVDETDKSVLSTTEKMSENKDNNLPKEIGNKLGVGSGNVLSLIKSLINNSTKEKPVGILPSIDNITNETRTTKINNTTTPIEKLYQSVINKTNTNTSNKYSYTEERVSPIDKMYNAVTNTDAFNKRYDKVMGDFKVDPVSMMQMRKMSNLLGVSVNNLMPSSVTKNEYRTSDSYVKDIIKEKHNETFETVNDSNVGVLKSIDNKLSAISSRNIGVNGRDLISPSISREKNPFDRIHEASKIINVSKINENNIEPSPIGGNFMKVLPVNNSDTESSSVRGLGKTDINLSINGTIKLEGGGKSVDLDLSKLINTPEFKRQIADIVTNRINEYSNSGKRNLESVRNNTSRLYDKSGN